MLHGGGYHKIGRQRWKRSLWITLHCWLYSAGLYGEHKIGMEEVGEELMGYIPCPCAIQTLLGLHGEALRLGEGLWETGMAGEGMTRFVCIGSSKESV